MRLAGEDILITINGEAVTLRPSLRAAIKLVYKYDTLAKIVEGIANGNVTMISDVIAFGAENHRAGEALFGDIERHSLARILAVLQKPLIDFVISLAGTPGDRDDDAKQDGETISFIEHYERLFGIGTGHLGWSTADTWAASPTEILAAHKGRIELLEMIFGTGEKTPDKPLSLDEKARLAFASIGTKKVHAA